MKQSFIPKSDKKHK